MSANQYSHRMLNPFHGIVNVVEIEGADAVSRDGVHWALYIQGKVDVEVLEDGAKCRIQLPDTKYGTWSPAEGLKRAPVRSVVNYAWLDALGSWLLDEVKARADAVPFPLRDHYELWLLDCDQGMPLALLDSACSRDALPERVSAQWRPGQLAGQEFRAPSLALDEGSEEGVPHCELLARIVRKAAGIAGRSRWFRRDAEGRGEMLDGNPEEVGVHARLFPLEAFPCLMLRESWSDERDRLLVRDFLAWQAPWLLTLQEISDTTRTALERAAFRQATRVAELYRLYPRVLDDHRLNAARVEAALRNSTTQAGSSEEESRLTFFVSGN